MKKSAKVVGVMVLVAGVVGIAAYAAQARLAINRLAINRLAINRLALVTKLAPNPLAATQLAPNLFELNTVGAGDLVATEGGRSVLSYAVSCALPAEITLEANQNSCTADDQCKEHNPDGSVNNNNPTFDGSCNAGTCRYDFHGALGLAPEWLLKRLSSGKGWISACLLARVNDFNTAEDISMRGGHPALTISQDEADLFTLEEGAFYGNLFTPADKPPVEIACIGEDKKAAGTTGGLLSRVCTEPDPANPGFTKCGFKFAGDCRNFTAFPSPFACEEFGPDGFTDHGSFYSACHACPGAGTWPNCLDEFDKVITIFVAP